MNLISDLKLYFYQQRLRREARAWLSANDATGLVAKLMIVLNRYAYHTWRGFDKEFIYKLKNCLVCHLYQAGYCVSASQQVQTLTCRGCGGTGQYSKYEKCYRCMGTGIYREHLLYSFEFLINGQLYNWHQPMSLVWWKVKCNELPSKYDGGHASYLELERQQVELYTMTIYEYLRKVGALEYRTIGNIRKRIELPMTLRKVISNNWKLWKSKLYWKRYHLKQRTRRVVAAVKGEPEPITEDEIPF